MSNVLRKEFITFISELGFHFILDVTLELRLRLLCLLILYAVASSERVFSFWKSLFTIREEFNFDPFLFERKLFCLSILEIVLINNKNVYSKYFGNLLFRLSDTLKYPITVLLDKPMNGLTFFLIWFALNNCFSSLIR